MTTPDPMVLDLVQALAGITYPEDTFPVFFDARAAQEVAKLPNYDTTDTSEEGKAAAKKFKDTLDKFQGSAYQFTIRGVPPEHLSNLSRETMRKVVNLEDDVNRVVETAIAQDEAENKIWALHIVKIVGPDGAVRAGITEEEAKALRAKLPEPAQEFIAARIEKMAGDTAAGYAVGISDFDFLSET